MTAEQKEIALRKELKSDADRLRMRRAHRMAHKIVFAVGDYQIALSLALKALYKVERDHEAAKKAGDKVRAWELSHTEASAMIELQAKSVGGVPAWAIKKDLYSENAMDVLLRNVSYKVVEESARAVKIEFSVYTKYGTPTTHTVWAGKSILVK